jgi:general secretion pathway protein I
LIALAIMATSLSAIGALIATTIRGTRSIEQYLTRIETARAILAAMPDRDQLRVGTTSGELAGHPWHMDVLPGARINTQSRQPEPWLPMRVAITIRSATGGVLQIDTVRLQRKTGP